jgi:hypothetical protein
LYHSLERGNLLNNITKLVSRYLAFASMTPKI